ncbi:hypothetical protein M9434_005206 [Picochlorum sp. BPE23]|nr:hypothetical protein M9434_005206 [Picochlorum sp. BPE23]
MSDSDISLFTDSENENDAELRVSSRVGLRNVPTAWNDVDLDELERSARGISSCLQTNGGLSNHELSQDDIRATEHEGSLLFKEFEGQNPHAFIRERFQNADVKDLVAARETLSKESMSHSKQLKKFVKDNFESCISNMDTIGEVAMRLHAASLEGGEGAHGATPAKVAEELHHVESVAEKSFSGLIKRYKLGQNLDSVLQLLGKYDSLVILPSMVRECIDSKDFEGVISLYQRAMNLVEMESGTTEEVHTIWNRLQTEVHKAMEAAVRTLHMIMHNPKLLLEESFEAACYLEKLKKLGVPAAADMDTMQEFTDFQVNEIISEMRTIHKEAQSLDMKRDSSTGERKHSHTWTAEKTHISTSRLCIQNLTVEFYEWCHEFWDLFKPSRNIEPFNCLWSLGQEHRGTALERVFSAYSELVESCMVEICETNDIVHESNAVIEFLTDCCFELDEDIGRIINPYYRDLVEHICQQVILALVAHLKTHAQKVFVIEDSCMDGFLPHQNIAWLHMVINEAMECVSRLSKRAMAIKVKVPPDSYPLHTLLKSCAETCADSVTRLAARKPVLSISGKEVDEFVLLVAWNTLEAVKISVLPRIVQTWSSLLNSAATPKENSQAFSWCCSKLEEAQEFVMKSWVEIKLEKLEPIMVDVLDVESRNVANTVDISTPKPCIRELCSILEAYDADIQIMVPVLQEEVMGEIHLAVIEGILNLMASDIFKTAAMQGVCQLWLDLSALHDWLIQHENEDDRMDRKGSVTLAESLLAEIEEHVRKQLKDEKILTVIKVKERIRSILDPH